MSKISHTSNNSNLSQSRKRSSSISNRNLLNRKSEVNLQVQDDPDWWIGLDPEASVFPNMHSKRFTNGPTDLLNTKSIGEQTVVKISSQPSWWENLPLEETEKNNPFQEIENNDNILRDKDLTIQAIDIVKGGDNAEKYDSSKKSHCSSALKAAPTSVKKTHLLRNSHKNINDTLEESLITSDTLTSKKKRVNNRGFSINNSGNPFILSNVWNDKDVSSKNYKSQSNTLRTKNSSLNDDSKSVEHSISNRTSVRNSSGVTDLLPVKRKKNNEKKVSFSGSGNPFLTNKIWSDKSDSLNNSTKSQNSYQKSLELNTELIDNNTKNAVVNDKELINSVKNNDFEINILKENKTHHSIKNDNLNEKKNQNILEEDNIKSLDSTEIKKNPKHIQAHSTKIHNISSQLHSSNELTQFSSISNISDVTRKSKTNLLLLSEENEKSNNNDQTINEIKDLTTKSYKSQNTRSIEKLSSQEVNYSLKDKKQYSSKRNISTKSKKNTSENSEKNTLKENELSSKENLNLSKENSKNSSKSTSSNINNKKHISEKQTFSNHLVNENVNILSSHVDKSQETNIINENTSQNHELNSHKSISQLIPLTNLNNQSEATKKLEKSNVLENNIEKTPTKNISVNQRILRSHLKTPQISPTPMETFEKLSSKKKLDQNFSQKTNSSKKKEIKRSLTFFEDENNKKKYSQSVQNSSKKQSSDHSLKETLKNNKKLKRKSVNYDKSNISILEQPVPNSEHKSELNYQSNVQKFSYNLRKSKIIDKNLVTQDNQHVNISKNNPSKVKELEIGDVNEKTNKINQENKILSKIGNQVDILEQHHVKNYSNNIQKRKKENSSDIQIDTDIKYSQSSITHSKTEYQKDTDNAINNNDESAVLRKKKNKTIVMKEKNKSNIENNSGENDSHQVGQLKKIFLRNYNLIQQSENFETSIKNKSNDKKHLSTNEQTQTSNSNLFIIQSQEITEAATNKNAISLEENKMLFDDNKNEGTNINAINITNTLKHLKTKGTKSILYQNKTMKRQNAIVEQPKEYQKNVKNSNTNIILHKTKTHKDTNDEITKKSTTINNDKIRAEVKNRNISNENSSCSNVTELLSNKSNLNLAGAEIVTQESTGENLSHTNSLTYSKFEKINILPKKLDFTHLEKMSTPLSKNVTFGKKSKEKAVNTHLENHKQQNKNNSSSVKRNLVSKTVNKTKKRSFQTFENSNIENSNIENVNNNEKRNSLKNYFKITPISKTVEMAKKNIFEITKNNQNRNEKMSLPSAILKRKESGKILVEKFLEAEEKKHVKPMKSLYNLKSLASKNNTKRPQNKISKKKYTEINEKQLSQPCKLKPWFSKKFIAFLEARLKPRYNEEVKNYVKQILYFIANAIHKGQKDVFFHDKIIDLLKKKLARLHIVETHLEFYCLVQDFFPYHCIKKIVPSIEPVSLKKVGNFNVELFSRKILD